MYEVKRSDGSDFTQFDVTCRTDGASSLHQFLQGYDVYCHNSHEGWGVFISRLRGGYLTATI